MQASAPVAAAPAAPAAPVNPFLRTQPAVFDMPAPAEAKQLDKVEALAEDAAGGKAD